MSADWDVDGFRARVQARSDRDRGRPGRAARPSRRRRRAAGRPGPHVGRRRQDVPRLVLLVGPPRRRRSDGVRRGRARPGLRLARAAARQRPGPRRPDGRLRHPPRPPGHAPVLRVRAPGGAGWRGDAEQYGAAAAILLGDLLLSWSEELLRRCGLPLDAVAAALEVFDLCRSEVITGQFLDVSAQARGHADVETAMTVLRYKSAKYSIERPIQIGAALAGASARDARAAVGVRAPAGRGLPAARRPARRLRRPGPHRQARGRRPRRGQAHGPGRPRARRRSARPRPPARRRPRHPPAARGPGRAAAGSSTTPAPTPRSRRSSSELGDLAARRLEAADRRRRARALRGLASAVTQRVVRPALSPATARRARDLLRAAARRTTAPRGSGRGGPASVAGTGRARRGRAVPSRPTAGPPAR